MNSFRVPAEWAPHRAYWLAFPYRAEEWSGSLESVQREYAAFCRGLTDMAGEQVRLLVRNEDVEKQARNLIGKNESLEYVRLAYGDSWLRDTLPLFGVDRNRLLHTISFQFNGWGGKYLMQGDERVQGEVIDWLDVAPEQRHRVPLVFEGGGIEFNGQGLVLTTASCVLNKNRNPQHTRQSVDRLLIENLGLEEILWLEQGLPFDHTDGHIDMVARFVAEKTLVYALPAGHELDASFRERCDQLGLRCLKLPAVLPRTHADQTIAASYTNFVIANRAVLVPQYGEPDDARAIEVLRECFPTRNVIGLSSSELIKGGGSLHCLSMQEPSVSP